jgi:lysozyme
MKTVSEKGLNFLIKEEGVVLHPYKDSVGVWTIGVGSTRYEDGTPVKATDMHITRERAMSLFKNTLKKYEAAVNEAIKSTINQNQFDALVSLCYNIGTAGFKGSTVAKKVNANSNDKTIADSFKMWKNAGGMPILLNRRIREARLYFS